MSLFLAFEIEHIIAKEVFTDDTRTMLLANAGITEEMRSNKIALWSDPEFVSVIQGGS